MGRKPIGARPLTNAEKQARRRKARDSELNRLRAFAAAVRKISETWDLGEGQDAIHDALQTIEDVKGYV